jgi:hypothetical protein
MLDGELAEIVAGESASARQLATAVAANAQQMQVIQDQLYQELRLKKQDLAQALQADLTLAKDRISAEFADRRQSEKDRLHSEYLGYQAKQDAIVVDLAEHLWQLP